MPPKGKRKKKGRRKKKKGGKHTGGESKSADKTVLFIDEYHNLKTDPSNSMREATQLLSSIVHLKKQTDVKVLLEEDKWDSSYTNRHLEESLEGQSPRGISRVREKREKEEAEAGQKSTDRMKSLSRLGFIAAQNRQLRSSSPKPLSRTDYLQEKYGLNYWTEDLKMKPIPVVYCDYRMTLFLTKDREPMQAAEPNATQEGHLATFYAKKNLSKFDNLAVNPETRLLSQLLKGVTDSVPEQSSQTKGYAQAIVKCFNLTKSDALLLPTTFVEGAAVNMGALSESIKTKVRESNIQASDYPNFADFILKLLMSDLEKYWPAEAAAMAGGSKMAGGAAGKMGGESGESRKLQEFVESALQIQIDLLPYVPFGVEISKQKIISEFRKYRARNVEADTLDSLCDKLNYLCDEYLREKLRPLLARVSSNMENYVKTVLPYWKAVFEDYIKHEKVLAEEYSKLEFFPKLLINGAKMFLNSIHGNNGLIKHIQRDPNDNYIKALIEHCMLETISLLLRMGMMYPKGIPSSCFSALKLGSYGLDVVFIDYIETATVPCYVYAGATHTEVLRLYYRNKYASASVGARSKAYSDKCDAFLRESYHYAKVLPKSETSIDFRVHVSEKCHGGDADLNYKELLMALTGCSMDDIEQGIRPEMIAQASNERQGKFSLGKEMLSGIRCIFMLNPPVALSVEDALDALGSFFFKPLKF